MTLAVASNVRFTWHNMTPDVASNIQAKWHTMTPDVASNTCQALGRGECVGDDPRATRAGPRGARARAVGRGLPSLTSQLNLRTFGTHHSH